MPDTMTEAKRSTTAYTKADELCDKAFYEGHPESKAKIRGIVNAHDDLVSAITEMVDTGCLSGRGEWLKAKVDAALAKAEGR